MLGLKVGCGWSAQGSEGGGGNAAASFFLIRPSEPDGRSLNERRAATFRPDSSTSGSRSLAEDCEGAATVCGDRWRRGEVGGWLVGGVHAEFHAVPIITPASPLQGACCAACASPSRCVTRGRSGNRCRLRSQLIRGLGGGVWEGFREGLGGEGGGSLSTDAPSARSSKRN